MLEASFVDRLLKENNAVLVTFIKKNGEERKMLCTTNLGLVPPASHPKGVGNPNPETKPVWDLQKQAWRSFRYDSVTDIEPVTYGPLTDGVA